MTNSKDVLEITLQRSVDRRKVIGTTAAAVAGAAVLGRTSGVSAASSRRTIGATATLRQDLPADAAAVDQQTIVFPSSKVQAKYLDIFDAVYERPEFSSDLFGETLVRLDRDFNLLPAGAESWTSSEDGMTWTFTIRQGMMWSDDTPVTAVDWLATYMYGADPNHAWDFSWYFGGVIKNWSQIVAAELPMTDLGVALGANEYEIVFQTEKPAPYLPAMLLYSPVLQAKALTETGGGYNTKPETSVSCGPFILQEWTPDQQIVLVKNEKYTGTLENVILNKVLVKLATSDAYFNMYQNDEIDFFEGPDPASLELMLSDPATAGEVVSGVGDFPTWYVFFDVTMAPWDNKLVRQAFSHAIDRDTLKEAVLGPAGTQAYSWLAPGFPASDREGLQDIQAYDVAKGQALLAEAGFPNGEGFGKHQLWLRNPSPLDLNVATAIGQMLKQNLNVDVELLQQDQSTFMDALNSKPTQIPMGFVRYGFDFFDAYNMLSVWLSGGRHSWVNEAFDTAVNTAAEYLGDPAEREQMFKDAERILVEDVPGVFVYHGTPVQFVKPWLKGDFIKPDVNGITSMHFPGFTVLSTVLQEIYIGADAPAR